MSVLTETPIETIERVGTTPQPVVGSIKSMLATEAKIRSERYSAKRESEEIGKTRAATAEQVAGTP